MLLRHAKVGPADIERLMAQFTGPTPLEERVALHMMEAPHDRRRA